MSGLNSLDEVKIGSFDEYGTSAGGMMRSLSKDKLLRIDAFVRDAVQATRRMSISQYFRKLCDFSPIDGEALRR